MTTYRLETHQAQKWLRNKREEDSLKTHLIHLQPLFPSNLNNHNCRSESSVWLPQPQATVCPRRGRRARWRGERSPPEPLVAAPVLAENRHSPPPIRVIAGVKLNHYHRVLSICFCSPSLICLSCCRRRHQLAGGDEDTTGASTSRSPPPDCLAIAA
nr:hypothetical protein Iba_chr09aCG14630 [Ipomoea batatas]